MANEIELDEEIMSDKTMAILELLENYQPEQEQWSSGLRQLYLLSMGVYKCQGDPISEEVKVNATVRANAAAEESKQVINEESKQAAD